MAQLETIIRYDGPALANHEMDVEELAPALLALASLIQSANHKFNGDRSAIRVVVNADIEQKCFQIKIKFVQDLLQHAKSFLDGDMATLKDICDWIGIGIGAGSTAFSLLRALVWLGRSQKDAVSFTTTQGDGSIALNVHELHLHGELPEPVRQLLADPEIVAKAQAIFKPTTRPGYDTLGFYAADGTPVFTATKRDAEGVLSLPSTVAVEPIEIDEEDAVRTPIAGRAGIKSRRDVGKAQWELKWAGKSVWAVIADDAWLDEYQAGNVYVPVGSWLDIVMEMTTSRSNADAPPSYRVIKVNAAIPPMPKQQGDMFVDDIDID